MHKNKDISLHTGYHETKTENDSSSSSLLLNAYHHLNQTTDSNSQTDREREITDPACINNDVKSR